MVKKYFIIMSVILGASLGVSACAQPQSFAVKAVHVTESGVWHSDPHGYQTAQDCKKFTLSDSQALSWFQKSEEVNEHTWREQLDWTQCSANGSLISKDGKTYLWNLDQSGRGEIFISKTVSVYLKGDELPF